MIQITDQEQTTAKNKGESEDIKKKEKGILKNIYLKTASFPGDFNYVPSHVIDEVCWGENSVRNKTKKKNQNLRVNV